MALSPGRTLRAFGRLAANPRSSAVGLALLWAAFFVGCIPIYLGLYPDEGDKLAIGLLIMRGSVLYRDLFTHQFPFTYYWLAAVFTLLGPTVLAARLSLLFLQLLAFATLMRLTQAVVPLGLAGVAWSATRHLYYGHMVLYNAFNGLALAVVFGLVLMALVGHARPNWRLWAVAGLAAAVAVLCDPLSVGPLAVVGLCLVINRKHWSGLIQFIAVGGLVLAVYVAYLALSGTWSDFYRDTILFNSQVYIKYYPLSLMNYTLQVISAASTGLNLVRPNTWLTVDAYAPNAHFAAFSQWLFGGLLQRVALLAFCLLLARQRRWRAALFTYLFAATLLPRTEVFFRQNAFMLVSYLASAMLLAALWPFPAAPTFGPVTQRLRMRVRRWGPALLAAVLVLWPAVLGLTILTVHLGAYGYDTNFLDTKHLAAKIRAATCGRDVALAYYPGDPTLYFFTGLRPVSKYVYLWPWVADVGLSDVLTSLGQTEAVVLFPQVESVWGIKTSDYLATLYTLVHTRFQPVGEMYLSPQLAAQCPPPAR